jgi:hypothetical protein
VSLIRVTKGRGVTGNARRTAQLTVNQRRANDGGRESIEVKLVLRDRKGNMTLLECGALLPVLFLGGRRQAPPFQKTKAAVNPRTPKKAGVYFSFPSSEVGNEKETGTASRQSLIRAWSSGLG